MTALGMFNAGLEAVLEAGIKRVVVWVVGLLVPGGAVAKLVESVYYIIKWIRDNAARLQRLMNLFSETIQAAFDPQKRMTIADNVENGLAGMLVPLASGVAAALNLGNIPDLIHEAIDKISEKIKSPIRSVLKGIGDFAGNAWETLLNSVGLGDMKDAVVKPTKFGPDHYSKLWVKPDGRVMLRESPDKTVTEAIQEGKRAGGDPICYKKAEDSEELLSKLAQKVSTDAKTSTDPEVLKKLKQYRAKAGDTQAVLAKALQDCDPENCYGPAKPTKTALVASHKTNESRCNPCFNRKRTTASPTGAAGTFQAIVEQAIDGGGKPITYGRAGFVASTNSAYNDPIICRVLHVSGPLKAPAQKTPRSGDPQEALNEAITRLSPDSSVRPKSFNAGHMVGLQYGGPDDVTTMVPQAQKLNTGGGSWWSMENQITKCLNECPNNAGTINVSISYHREKTKRFLPFFFHVKLLMGSKTQSLRFKNENDGRDFTAFDCNADWPSDPQ